MREKTARGGGKKTHFSFTSSLTITGFCWSAGYANAYAVAMQLAQLPAAADHYLAGRFAPALPLVAAGAGSARQNGAEPRSNLPPRRGGAGPGRTTALSRGGGEGRNSCPGATRVTVPSAFRGGLAGSSSALTERLGRGGASAAALPSPGSLLPPVPPYLAQWSGRPGAGPAGLAGDAKSRVVKRQFRTVSSVRPSFHPSFHPEGSALCPSVRGARTARPGAGRAGGGRGAARGAAPGPGGAALPSARGRHVVLWGAAGRAGL